MADFNFTLLDEGLGMQELADTMSCCWTMSFFPA